MSNEAIESLPYLMRRRLESGLQDDGTYVMNVQFRFTPKDEIALRALNLVDPEASGANQVPVDMGLDMAIMGYFSRAISTLNLEPFEVQQVELNCNPAAGAVPGEHFN